MLLSHAEASLVRVRQLLVNQMLEIGPSSATESLIGTGPGKLCEEPTRYTVERVDELCIVLERV